MNLGIKVLLACIFSSALVSAVHALENQQLQQVVTRYQETISQFNLPYFQLGYLDNLNVIQNTDSRQRQRDAFDKLLTSLKNVKRATLSLEDRYVYDHLQYRLDLHLRRVDLEDRFRNLHTGEVTSTAGIFHQPLGKEWYLYFLQTWLSVEREPAWLMEFGEREVAKSRQQMHTLQQQAGFDNNPLAFFKHVNDAQFFLTSTQEIENTYRQKESIVAQHLASLFFVDQAPQFALDPWPDSDKDTPPGRVVRDPEVTFEYNYFQERHNTQDMDFLLLHEAVPGHLFAYQYMEQRPFDNGLNLTMSAYHGLSEGWGAYVEEFGEELGLYQTPYDYLGRVKFDLVRSTRIALDVGINYYGWNNEKALAYWHENIQGQDDIAQREIDRVRRWPGQAISYKVGADTILTLKQKARAALGGNFDIREFHHQILGFGSVPLFLVEERVKNYINGKLMSEAAA